MGLTAGESFGELAKLPLRLLDAAAAAATAATTADPDAFDGAAFALAGTAPEASTAVLAVGELTLPGNSVSLCNKELMLCSTLDCSSACRSVSRRSPSSAFKFGEPARVSHRGGSASSE